MTRKLTRGTSVFLHCSLYSGQEHTLFATTTFKQKGEYTMSTISTTSHGASFLPKLDLRSLLKKSFAINPLLTLFGLSMVVTFIATLIGIFVDPRVITGALAWEKPAKFAISGTVYCFTLLWMLNFVQGHKRLVNLVANAIAISFLIEMIAICGQVVRGTTSHFNVSTPLDSALYATMAAFVLLIWCMTFVAALLLLRQRMPNPVLASSLRLGIFLSLVGMLAAFLMTEPTAMQLAAQKISGHFTTIGAHSVGVADGGPGIPFLGWSTVGGDLRIPHFVGLHALQVVPFVGWLLSLLPLSFLRVGHKVALVWTFAASYLALIALLTWQALRAQSLIAPDALTLQAFALLIGSTALVVIAVVTHARLSVRG